ncbi:MAG: DUF4910 domain-containing protein [Pseudomonadota bacterium]
MFNLLKQLFPICRSITGEGVRKTLSILQGEIPIKIHEIPTGTKVFDWEIPKEWNIRDAWIKDHSGNRIIDFQKNNLHIVNYSIPFEGELTLAELQKHLYSLPEQPDAIPYVTSYYNDNWGFCLKDSHRTQLRDDTYKIKVDSSLDQGHLTYADLLIKGKSDQEILFSTYICHPSLANNELSGPVLTAFIAKELIKQKNLNYSYRFVFIPETIGSIAYISQHLNHLKEYVIGGWIVTCVGLPGKFTYLKGHKEDTITERVSLKTLKSSGKIFEIRSFLDRGSDERQFCSPGVDLPIGSLMRTKYGEYPEYHTSLDNLECITEKAMEESFDVYMDCIKTFEKLKVYRPNVICEPQLGRRGLYRDISTKKMLNQDIIVLKNFLSYCDGFHETEWIADKINIPIQELKNIISILLKEKLIR